VLGTSTGIGTTGKKMRGTARILMDKVGEAVMHMDVDIGMRFPVWKCRMIKNFSCKC
jgi:hypothetical protein